VTSPLSLGQRAALAWRNFFRILGDPSWAQAVSDLSEAPKLVAPTPQPSADALPSSSNAKAPSETHASALLMLSLLQRHGRFLDFVQQDIQPFSDAEVGQVARVVHAGCNKALAEHLSLAPVRREAEGTRVTVQDAAAARKTKLTGNVLGSPPYQGVLKHRGWQSERIELPELMPGADSSVLALAEVEL